MYTYTAYLAYHVTKMWAGVRVKFVSLVLYLTRDTEAKQTSINLHN